MTASTIAPTADDTQDPSTEPGNPDTRIGKPPERPADETVPRGE